MYRDFKDVPEEEAEEAGFIARNIVMGSYLGVCPEHILNAFTEMLVTHSGVSNIRIARSDNQKSVEQYQVLAEQRHNGEARIDYRIRDGNVEWMFGCNYDY